MMPENDTYLAIRSPSGGMYKEKGSKFLGYVFPVRTEDAVRTRINEVKSAHHGARHFCYAYVIGAKREIYRANDDGEPSDTAGKPILGQINSANLTNVLVVVVRYFGGTKLGVGGLINAYRSAAADALDHAETVERTVNNIYQLSFKYEQMGEVMKIVKDHGLRQLEQDFGMDCALKLVIRKNKTAKVSSLFEKIVNLDMKLIRTE